MMVSFKPFALRVKMLMLTAFPFNSLGRRVETKTGEKQF